MIVQTKELTSYRCNWCDNKFWHCFTPAKDEDGKEICSDCVENVESII